MHRLGVTVGWAAFAVHAVIRDAGLVEHVHEVKTGSARVLDGA
jgi:hypothetical protein